MDNDARLSFECARNGWGSARFGGHFRAWVGSRFGGESTTPPKAGNARRRAAENQPVLSLVE